MQCNHWTERSRCDNAAEVYLVAPDGKDIPGGYCCFQCAVRIINEYLDKLGEVWLLRAITLAEGR